MLKRIIENILPQGLALKKINNNIVYVAGSYSIWKEFSRKCFLLSTILEEIISEIYQELQRNRPEIIENIIKELERKNVRDFSYTTKIAWEEDEKVTYLSPYGYVQRFYRKTIEHIVGEVLKRHSLPEKIVIIYKGSNSLFGKIIWTIRRILNRDETKMEINLKDILTYYLTYISISQLNYVVAEVSSKFHPYLAEATDTIL